ncbi:MAG: MFS transporter [Candidatus Latescibacterota bacterium]
MDTDTPLNSVSRLRAMRAITLAQCSGALGSQSFESNFVLLYLATMGMGRSRILMYLAILPLAQAILVLPAAWWADGHGKKLVGRIGLTCTVVGFAAIALAGSFQSRMGPLLIGGGATLFAMGMAMFSAGWLALLSPIVPQEERGRFFAKLRISWRTVGIVFAGLCGLLLSKDTPVGTFQLVFVVVVASQIGRLLLYRGIPEVEGPTAHRVGVRTSLVDIFRLEGFASFSCYLFLLTLFTANSGVLLGLIEKKILFYGDGLVVWMANLSMIGSLLGFLIGGWIVDRVGTKSVFLACHFSFGAILSLSLFRGLFQIPSVLVMGPTHFLFGVVISALSIALSTEILALLPKENKSLAAAAMATLQYGGMGVSGMLSAWVLGAGLLRDTWSLWGDAHEQLRFPPAPLRGHGRSSGDHPGAGAFCDPKGRMAAARLLTLKTITMWLEVPPKATSALPRKQAEDRKTVPSGGRIALLDSCLPASCAAFAMLSALFPLSAGCLAFFPLTKKGMTRHECPPENSDLLLGSGPIC